MTNNVVRLELDRGSSVLWCEGLAVATLGSVDLDHDEEVVLDDSGEVVLLQNDDVLVVHLGLVVRLLRRVVEVGKVVEVIIVAVVILKEGEIFVVE
ncbi:hypothetical protein GYH30_001022 [Glycine max]|nr:hypothetical protein GYH30_001022 [Glycine max]